MAEAMESRKQMWSDIQMESMPMSSASCASSIISWIE